MRVRPPYLLLVGAISASALADTAPSSRPLAACEIKPAKTTSRTFGTAHAGFVEWVGRSGRLVLLDEFRTDDDKDGKITVEFSEHGMPVGDKPTVIVVDTIKKQETKLDDVIAFDPSGRYLAALVKGAVTVFDDRDGRKIDLSARGADATPDDNPAQGGRQVSFGPTGIVGYFKQGIPTLLDLETGDERTLPAAKGLAWRMEPSARLGWARVLEINTDSNADGKLAFPEQQTTCGIRYCNRFAKATSSHGYSPRGDAFEPILESDHVKIDSPMGHEVPIADDAWLDDQTHVVKRAGGAQLALPDGCFDPIAFEGSDALLLECRAGSRVWWPLANREVEIAGFVRPLRSEVVLDDGGHRWLGVEVSTSAWKGAGKLARLSLETGELQTGPEVDADGGLVRTTKTGVLVLDVAAGKTLTLPGGRYDEANEQFIAADGKPVTIDACTSIQLAADDAPAGARCAVRAKGKEAPISRGPWTIRCTR